MACKEAVLADPHAAGRAASAAPRPARVVIRQRQADPGPRASTMIERQPGERPCGSTRRASACWSAWCSARSTAARDGRSRSSRSAARLNSATGTVGARDLSVRLAELQPCHVLDRRLLDDPAGVADRGADVDRQLPHSGQVGEFGSLDAACSTGRRRCSWVHAGPQSAWWWTYIDWMSPTSARPRHLGEVHAVPQMAGLQRHLRGLHLHPRSPCRGTRLGSTRIFSPWLPGSARARCRCRAAAAACPGSRS